MYFSVRKRHRPNLINNNPNRKRKKLPPRYTRITFLKIVSVIRLPPTNSIRAQISFRSRLNLEHDILASYTILLLQNVRSQSRFTLKHFSVRKTHSDKIGHCLPFHLLFPATLALSSHIPQRLGSIFCSSAGSRMRRANENVSHFSKIRLAKRKRADHRFVPTKLYTVGPRGSPDRAQDGKLPARSAVGGLMTQTILQNFQPNLLFIVRSQIFISTKLGHP